MTMEVVRKRLELYTMYHQDTCQWNAYLDKKKIRHMNFPSEISENIVKFVFFHIYKIMPTWNTLSGDLEFLGQMIEVKAFSSHAPTTFGPYEKWNMIFFLDATEFQKQTFRLYECRIANTDPLWQNLLVNRYQTYADQCMQGRRPRILFSKIHQQLGNKCRLIFEGTLDELKN